MFTLASAMSTYTILCLSNDPCASDIARGLRSNVYQLLVTGSTAQAMAYLFVNRRIDAVILDHGSEPHAGVGVARLLRSVRPDIPILLLCQEMLEPLPNCVDACLSGEDIPAALDPTLNLLLTMPAGDLAVATSAR